MSEFRFYFFLLFHNCSGTLVKDLMSRNNSSVWTWLLRSVKKYTWCIQGEFRKTQTMCASPWEAMTFSANVWEAPHVCVTRLFGAWYGCPLSRCCRAPSWKPHALAPLPSFVLLILDHGHQLLILGGASDFHVACRALHGLLFIQYSTQTT